MSDAKFLKFGTLRSWIRPATAPHDVIDITGTGGYKRAVTANTPVPATRRYLWLIVIALVIATAFVVVARRRAAPGAEDCEKKPPPTAFAVADCDAGAAPAAHP